MVTQITDQLKQKIDASESFTGIFNTKDESDSFVTYLQTIGYTVVVPNLKNLELTAKTKKAIILVNDKDYDYENSSGFDIVIGGKVKQEQESFISTETKVVPVPSDKDVSEVVQELKNGGYMVFSPTQPDPPPPIGAVTGESKQIIFDESHPFSPPFPEIPSPIKPIPGQSLWVVVGVKIQL